MWGLPHAARFAGDLGSVLAVIHCVPLALLWLAGFTVRSCSGMRHSIADLGVRGTICSFNLHADTWILRLSLVAAQGQCAYYFGLLPVDRWTLDGAWLLYVHGVYCIGQLRRPASCPVGQAR